MKYVLALLLVLWTCPGYAEMYKWVDEKGTVHFADDPSRIPEKYRRDAESRSTPKETPSPKSQEKPEPRSSVPQSSGPASYEVDLFRRGEISLAEVVLNGRAKQYFVVDTGASFTSISRQTARDLGITIDETTPILPIFTASDVILTPLVTLRSVRVGKAEVENVDALVHNMPGATAGLLGNSFLNRFQVVIDSQNGKMTLFPLQGKPSPDRPGGYGRDNWAGRFRFYHTLLEGLKKMKVDYERQGSRAQVNQIDQAIRHFENQLSDLDRKASFAGVPRNWRE